MKKIWLMLLVVMFVGCTSLEVAKPVADPTVVKTLDTSKNKDDAFVLSMRWLSQTYNSSKSVIDYSDKTAGTINGKGIMSVTLGLLPVNITYSIIIDLKDSKARLTFRALSNDFEHVMAPRLFELFQKRVEILSADYSTFLSTQKADW